MCTVRSDGEKLQITKLAQHDEREKRLLEKKRITRFAQNTENMHGKVHARQEF